VTGISNNSGHYKPGKLHIKNFLDWCHQHRCVDPDGTVMCLGTVGGAFVGTVRQFYFSFVTL
jgi:hypothetical protein